jgi:hypothetical protein
MIIIIVTAVETSNLTSIGSFVIALARTVLWGKTSASESKVDTHYGLTGFKRFHKIA